MGTRKQQQYGVITGNTQLYVDFYKFRLLRHLKNLDQSAVIVGVFLFCEEDVFTPLHM